MKIATVVLTRGYVDIAQYDTLIKRNKGVYRHMYEPPMDNIVFHEGNITEDQQCYIQEQTPNLPLRFVNVHDTESKAFRHENTLLNTGVTHPTLMSNKKEFHVGYKHMCHFWFCDFVECCKEYDYVIRVDEDCFIEASPTLQELARLMVDREIKYMTPSLFHGIDAPDVTVGLPEFASKYIKEVAGKDMVAWYSHMLPYTNCFMVDVKHFLNFELYKNFARLVHESGAIYINRWGDLPLWGIIVSNLMPLNHFCVLSNIKYYHGSHQIMVN